MNLGNLIMIFPEGNFINEKNNNLIVFEKDSNNPKYQGFICFWEIKDIDCKQLRFKKRVSKFNAYKSIVIFYSPQKQETCCIAKH